MPHLRHRFRGTTIAGTPGNIVPIHESIAMNDIGRYRIHVRGTVQGVGFRPFVYRTACELGLTGWVSNTRRGVEIEVQGSDNARDRLVAALRENSPPLARVESVDVQQAAPVGPSAASGFTIVDDDSETDGDVAPVAPDAVVCADCLRELLDPADRRYRYPFITCTHCGPRFTIVESVPYDRPSTTMAGFPMCDQCRAEYEEPADRRFHAQPIACPDCGPRVRLADVSGATLPVEDPIAAAVERLAAGDILAVKGLGGYHFACDARNADACELLRSRKSREVKPFAVMVRDLDVARSVAAIDEAAAALLTSTAAPVVIVPMKPESGLAPGIAPGRHTVGLMLPYTPLHHLLFADGACDALVMTSGNLSEEPIAFEDDDAFARLGSIADAFLTHDRPIRTRTDDSVVMATGDLTTTIRRSRGYAPAAITLPEPLTGPVLACGGHLKHTFCIGTSDRARLSHHIGDLENESTWRSLLDGVEHFTRLFDIEPEIAAHDLHPDYLSTRYAESLGIPTDAVQHHHAHIVSCLTENRVEEPVVGIAFDGTGYGDDGSLWGGEWLVADSARYRRVAHLRPLRLPGGERAIREPWRLGAAMLDSVYGDEWRGWSLPIEDAVVDETWSLLRSVMEASVATPESTAVGRLYDAVAAVTGVRGVNMYEAQGAIEFEQLVDRAARGAYEFSVDESTRLPTLDWEPALRDIVRDIRRGVDVPVIAARFHRGLARGVAGLSPRVAESAGLASCALSGGVFQNAILTSELVALLEQAGLTVCRHRDVPPNDGGISLGQLVVADRNRPE